MNSTRRPAVAGTFYPADPIQLQHVVSSLIEQAAKSYTIPKAMIVPHAGYVYSGPIAASGYALLQESSRTIKNVVLLGPSHRVGFSGLAVSSADKYQSPLGEVEINQALVDEISRFSCVHELDHAHALEHSLEVHLPFLQEVLESFSLIPIVAGDVAPSEVCGVLDVLWGGPETIVIVSSDLSHYHDYETAKKLDRSTSDAIEALNWRFIDSESACGKVAVNGLLVAAQKRSLEATTIDLRNSGDTAGTKDRVVGYGTYVFA